MAYQGVQASGEALLVQALATPETGGTICTGIEKLVQWFLIEFLTETGTMTYAPTRGTNFMTDVNNGSLQTEQDVFMAFSSAVGQIQATLQRIQKTTDPPDEIFADAVLTNLALTGNAIILYITITSKAGTSRTPILPISLAV